MATYRRRLTREKVLQALYAHELSNEPIAGIMRFHNALRELLGRRGIRNDVSRYEAIGLGMVEMEVGNRGALLEGYPIDDSPLRIERFFDTLYLRYDERFVTSAPDLSAVTRRLEWAAGSPALQLPGIDYSTRILDASNQLEPHA